MPKGRHLKPDFFTDKRMVSVSPLARILYQGLWCFAADCGHLDDEPIEFKMRILPADACDVDELLGELVREGRVVRAIVNGAPLIYLPTLAVHARIDKRYETLCDACKDPDGVNAARFGNHVRWHEKRGVVAPDCEFCPSDTGSPHIVATTGNDPKPDTDTSGPHRDHIADGDGDGDGDNSPTGSGTNKPRKRGSRLPDDWIPSKATRDQMAAENPHVDQRAEHAKFCDYWHAKAGKDAVKVDWDATWRNWIRRAGNDASERRPLHPVVDEYKLWN